MIKNILTTMLMLLATLASAQTADFDSELKTIQKDWAEANYQAGSEDAKKKMLAALSERAHAFSVAHPKRAEALIWEGIVLSTYAGAKGGLGALGIAKKSKAVLEEALQIDPQALEGSAYTSLGALYSKVPGFPVGFGSDKKARELLQKALAINPTGIDQNYFYADFLVEQKEYAEASRYLAKALQAAPRPGRELADSGRRQEIAALQEKIRTKSSS